MSRFAPAALGRIRRAARVASATLACAHAGTTAGAQALVRERPWVTATRPTRNELHARRPRPATLRGIAFTVDSTPDRQVPGSDEAQTRLFTGFTADVTCAAGRGRLDIVSTTRAPARSANGVTIAGPLAGPGDYYLFDSTGALLVRPARRTYARLPFTYSHVGPAEDRTGWPSEWWEISPIRVRPMPTAAPADTVQHGEVSIFWHLERGQRTPAVHELARGRLTLRDAPVGEVGVARWFGAAEALAAAADLLRPDGGGPLGASSGGPLGLTAVVPVRAAPGAQTNFVMQHGLADVRVVDVDASRFALPGGFAEVRWPGDGRVHPGRE